MMVKGNVGLHGWAFGGERSPGNNATEQTTSRALLSRASP